MPYRNYPTEVFEDLRQLVRANAERFDARTLFAECRDEKVVTLGYRAYKERVEALGTALWARGLHGKRILICGKSGMLWATAFLAVAGGLGTAIPVDHTLPAETVAALARRADADAVIAPAQLLRSIAALCPKLRRIAFEDLPALIAKGEHLIMAGRDAYRRVSIDPNAPTVLIYPDQKAQTANGVMHSHRTLCFATAELCRMVEVLESDTFLSVLPMHYAAELICGFLLPMSRGASIAFGDGVRTLPRDLKRFCPSVIFGVPLLLRTLYDRIWAEQVKKGEAETTKAIIKATDGIASETLRIKAKRRALASIHAKLGGRLRLLVSCLPEVEPDLLSGYRALGIAAIQGYFVNGCAAMVAINRDRYFNDRSAGLPMPHTFLDVYEADENGRGEIRFRGDHVMLGYYGDPAEGTRRLCDGWFYTGDVGYVDEDGFLFVTGKKKNAFLAPSGKRVAPEELEARLDKRPYIKESCVMLGKHHKRDRSAVVAVIVPDLDKIAETYGTAFTRADVELEVRRAVAAVNATLPRGERMDSYRIRTEPLPRSASQTLLRREI